MQENSKPTFASITSTVYENNKNILGFAAAPLSSILYRRNDWAVMALLIK